MSTTRDYIFKYRNVNPLEKLRDGEPYFFLRAQDKLSPEAVEAYSNLLKRESDKARSEGNGELADSLLKQALGVLAVVNKFMDWQDDNAQYVKMPD